MMKMKKWISYGLRILFGLMLIVSGSNRFLCFIPIDHPEGLAGEVMEGFVKAGYLLPLVAVLLIGIGIMFVFNKFIPVAAVLLVPLSINFVGFHLAVDMAGIAPAAFVFIVNVYFLFLYRHTYVMLLRTKSL